MDQERLKRLLKYDPESGLFTWNESRGRVKRGTVAGSTSSKGYTVIGLGGKTYKAHRLAWLYMTGAWPLEQIDHRDGQKANNKWNNLREATHAQNSCNRSPYNKTGFKGVIPGPNGKYFGKTSYKGEKCHSGAFDTPEEASEWVTAARTRLHGEFAAHTTRP